MKTFILHGVIIMSAAVSVQAENLDSAIQKAQDQTQPTAPFEIEEMSPKFAVFEWNGDRDTVEETDE